MCKMEAYKFETTVLDNGVIQIPEMAKYKNKKVQVFLIPEYSIQEGNKQNNIQHVEEFINTWVGYFSDIETDDIRYNAIMGKDYLNSGLQVCRPIEYIEKITNK